MAETTYIWTGPDDTGLPYPTGGSPPDGANQIKKLAESIAIYGTGRPDTDPQYDDAPTGSQYIFTGDQAQLDAVFGARAWRKTPTGWVCTEGDTGPQQNTIGFSASSNFTGTVKWRRTAALASFRVQWGTDKNPWPAVSTFDRQKILAAPENLMPWDNITQLMAGSGNAGGTDKFPTWSAMFYVGTVVVYGTPHHVATSAGNYVGGEYQCNAPWPDGTGETWEGTLVEKPTVYDLERWLAKNPDVSPDEEAELRAEMEALRSNDG